MQVHQRTPLSHRLGVFALIAGLLLLITILIVAVAVATNTEVRYQLWKRDLAPAFDYSEEHDFIYRLVFDHNLQPEEWREEGGTEGELTGHDSAIRCFLVNERCQRASDL
jgi:hypothetical protein